MKIIVFSDTHGSIYTMRKVMKLHQDAQIVVHCGDSQGEIEDIKLLYPSKKYITVKGNCDYGSMLPVVEFFTAEGVNFLVCHGHTFNVKFELTRLLMMAKEKEVNVVLYGHTHVAHDEYLDGVLFFNPGSAGYSKTYGIIEVKNGQVLSNVTHI